MPYTEVTLEVINRLKERGFTSLQLVSPDPVNPDQATIELIPGKRSDFELNLISLNSTEIHDYIDGHSPMAKYIINQDYVADPG